MHAYSSRRLSSSSGKESLRSKLIFCMLGLPSVRACECEVRWELAVLILPRTKLGAYTSGVAGCKQRTRVCVFTSEPPLKVDREPGIYSAD